jgi:hypothetical protein
MLFALASFLLSLRGKFHFYVTLSLSVVFSFPSVPENYFNNGKIKVGTEKLTGNRDLLFFF